MPDANFAGLLDLGLPPGTLVWALNSVDELSELADTLPEAQVLISNGLQQGDVDPGCDLLIRQINIVRPVLRTCPLIPANTVGYSGNGEDEARGKLLDFFKDPVKLINTLNTVIAILRLFQVPVPPITLPAPSPAV